MGTSETYAGTVTPQATPPFSSSQSELSPSESPLREAIVAPAGPRRQSVELGFGSCSSVELALPSEPPDEMATLEAVEQVRKLHVLVTRLHALISKLQGENKRCARGRTRCAPTSRV